MSKAGLGLGLLPVTKTFLVIDTSYLLELFAVPGNTQLQAAKAVQAKFAQAFNSNAQLFVPLPVLFELAKGERIAAKAWDVLPVAFESLLIEDAETWDRMRSYRNESSHEYKLSKAIEIAAFVRSQAYPALCALRAELARRA